MATTALERALDGQAARTRTPLDALQLAREQWVRSGRVDMGALAAELGVSRATLHRWVGTRELLLGEVLWSYAEAALLQSRAAARGSGADYLVDVLERYMRAALEFEPLVHFIEQDPQYALKVLASKHSPMQRRSIVAMREQLVEQVRAGRLEPALALDDLAYLVVRVVESYLYSDVITGSEPDIGKATDAIAVLLHAAPAPRRRRARVARPAGSERSRARGARPGSANARA
jgi:AcrR family transcriptional regulator